MEIWKARTIHTGIVLLKKNFRPVLRQNTDIFAPLKVLVIGIGNTRIMVSRNNKHFCFGNLAEFFIYVMNCRLSYILMFVKISAYQYDVHSFLFRKVNYPAKHFKKVPSSLFSRKFLSPKSWKVRQDEYPKNAETLMNSCSVFHPKTSCSLVYHKNIISKFLQKWYIKLNILYLFYISVLYIESGIYYRPVYFLIIFFIPITTPGKLFLIWIFLLPPGS